MAAVDTQKIPIDSESKSRNQAYDLRSNDDKLRANNEGGLPQGNELEDANAKRKREDTDAQEDKQLDSKRLRSADAKGEAKQAAAKGGNFVLNISARCQGKKDEKMRMTPDQAGEDSFFVSASHNCMGVADGVGGWRSKGVDPGAISRSLMANCHRIVKTKPNTLQKGDMMQIMSDGYQAVLQDENVQGGSCTCCIVALGEENGKPRLLGINMGDSGFAVVRNGKVVLKSKYLRKAENTPFQLAVLRGAHKLHNHVHCDPSEAQVFDEPLEEGDIIVMGSDGIWDNVICLGPDELKRADKNDRVRWETIEDESGCMTWVPKTVYKEGDAMPTLEFIINGDTDPEVIATNLLKRSAAGEFKPDDCTVIVARLQRM